MLLTILLHSPSVQNTKKILANFLLLMKGHRFTILHATAPKNIQAAAYSNIKEAFSQFPDTFQVVKVPDPPGIGGRQLRPVCQVHNEVFGNAPAFAFNISSMD